MSSPADPLMPSTRAAHHWTTANLGEAAPGVLTPLSLALWGEPAERAARRALWTIGVLRGDELEPPPDPGDWLLRPFHGRLAMQLEVMALAGDRMPGVSGEDALRGMFGEAPATMTFAPTRSRYAAIALRLPRAFATLPARVRTVAGEQDAWWRRSVAAAGTMDGTQARALFVEAQQRFGRTSSLQLVATMSTIQPLYDALGALVARAGTGEVATLSGVGGAEMDVVGDIWRASRGELTLAQVAATHGFHGPLEGEISSRVWREDDRPLAALVERYAGRGDDEDPAAREAGKSREMAAMQQEVLQALAPPLRPAARTVLRLAAERIPYRGIAKRSFLQAIDVARAAARRVGELDGLGDDVFLLTAQELVHATPSAGLIEERRRGRAGHLRVRLAEGVWRGLPLVVEDAPSAPADVRDVVTGTGVSTGVVEGTARIVTDPTFADVEPDEILVAPTTDPSWGAIMFISAGLVVDIGGALSHAAVVARELGIPCVVGTGDGTRVLRTGDRIRVDGGAGTVEILSRSAQGAAVG